VFTSRYALSLCIKQIRFVFKGLIPKTEMTKIGPNHLDRTVYGTFLAGPTV
jgi:hypothetical protein